MSEGRDKYGIRGKASSDIYMEDFHFYKDLDPEEIPGGDGVDPNILKSGDFPQGGKTRRRD